MYACAHPLVRQILCIIKYCYRWAWNVEGNQLWQGIKRAGERWNRVHRSIIHDSHGWPWMSQTFVAFPARVLMWGYLSQRMGSIRKTRENTYLTIAMASIAPSRPLILMRSLHQREMHCVIANFSWGLEDAHERVSLELHVVSHRHGLPHPASTLAPLGEGL
jgi:hypothetical protein